MTAKKTSKTKKPFTKTVSEADLTHCSVDTYPCNGQCGELHRGQGPRGDTPSTLCTSLMEAPKRVRKQKKKQQRRPKPRDDDD